MDSEKEINRLGQQHKGFKFERTKCSASYREKTFYKHWKKLNTNQDAGMLQGLFGIYGNPLSIFSLKGWMLRVTMRERYIVATIIQWLGTNVGWCFLEGVLRDCGYQITQTEEGKKLQKEMNDKFYKSGKQQKDTTRQKRRR